MVGQGQARVAQAAIDGHAVEEHDGGVQEQVGGGGRGLGGQHIFRGWHALSGLGDMEHKKC